MEKFKHGEMEARFADLIWMYAPVSSGRLVMISEETLNWKKSTTYMMLKRLCDRGIFQNTKGMVIALMSKEDFAVHQGEEFLKDSFGGSLPQFLAAFTRRKQLSDKDISLLQRLIDEHKEE